MSERNDLIANAIVGVRHVIRTMTTAPAGAGCHVLIVAYAGCEPSITAALLSDGLPTGYDIVVVAHTVYADQWRRWRDDPDADLGLDHLIDNKIETEIYDEINRAVEATVLARHLMRYSHEHTCSLQLV